MSMIRRRRRRGPLYQPGAVYCRCGKSAQMQRYDDGIALCPECRAAKARKEEGTDDKG